MLTLISFLQSAMLHIFVFAFGCLLYTIGEFWVHNILCHHRRLKWASKIHWDHHKIIGGIEKAKLEAEAYSKVTTPVLAAITMPFVWMLFSIFVGFEFGFTIALAFAVSYMHYEYVHWRVHCRAPRDKYEQKLLQHHFAHHYCDPKRYQSVSLPALDHFFGTMPSPEKQAEHFEKVKTKKPLNSEDNLWTWIFDMSSRYRSFPENFSENYEAQYLNAQTQ
jgi:hypothetical protein